MKIKLLGLLVIGLAIGIAAAFIYSHPKLSKLVVSQPIVTEDRDVFGYNQISFSGVGELQIIQTGLEGVTISAVQNILSDIETKVDNQVLVINYQWDWQKNTLNNQRPIKIIVQVINLHQLNITGAGSISSPNLKSPRLNITLSGASQADLNLDTEALIVDLTGAGQITLKGTVYSQQVNIAGAGQYLAKNLSSQNANVTISGLGLAEIDVDKNLVANISGGGKISYLGKPRITQQITGLGSLTKMY